MLTWHGRIGRLVVSGGAGFVLPASRRTALRSEDGISSGWIWVASAFEAGACSSPSEVGPPWRGSKTDGESKSIKFSAPITFRFFYLIFVDAASRLSSSGSIRGVMSQPLVHFFACLKRMQWVDSGSTRGSLYICCDCNLRVTHWQFCEHSTRVTTCNYCIQLQLSCAIYKRGSGFSKEISNDTTI